MYLLSRRHPFGATEWITGVNYVISQRNKLCFAVTDTQLWQLNYDN